MTSTTGLLALAAVVTGAFAVETAAGFGSTILMLTLGAALFPLPWLLSVVIPVNLVVSAAVLYRERRSADLRFLLRELLPAMMLGALPGLALAGLMGDGRGPKAVYALFVVVLSSVELFVRRRAAAGEGAPLSRPAAWGWLMAGGLAHGLFASSGPLVVYAASRRLTDKNAFRGTLAALWLTMNALLVAGYALHGALTPEVGRTAALMLPPTGLGMLLGEWVHRRLDAGRFRTAVYSTMLAGGLTLLATAA